MQVKLGEGNVEVTREIDGGLETIRSNLPAVVSADLRLNQPRFAKLQMILKARKKKIEKKTPNELGIDLAPRMEIVRVDEPPVREAGKKVESVDDLVSQLKKEGVL